jgi:hypothetical protein
VCACAHPPQSSARLGQGLHTASLQSCVTSTRTTDRITYTSSSSRMGSLTVGRQARRTSARSALRQPVALCNPLPPAPFFGPRNR